MSRKYRSITWIILSVRTMVLLISESSALFKDSFDFNGILKEYDKSVI